MAEHQQHPAKSSSANRVVPPVKVMARSYSSTLLIVAVALVLTAPLALAGDPDYLQDLCVADLNSGKLPSTLFFLNELDGHAPTQKLPSDSDAKRFAIVGYRAVSSFPSTSVRIFFQE